MNPFTRIAAILLGIISLLHLLRLITHWKVMINEYELPLWTSIVAFLISLILFLGLWKESKKS